MAAQQEPQATLKQRIEAAQHGYSNKDAHVGHIGHNLLNGLGYAGSLSEYFRLLVNHAQFREGEFRSIKGHFPDIELIDRGGKDYHKFYVDTAKERLEQSTIT